MPRKPMTEEEAMAVATALAERTNTKNKMEVHNHD